eukprot:TRINITY_DN23268_c0_g1_i1.p1 TRINITY_DN23268_c0_g1~~TRINITY_DN23268_c0_g1_i1.p1  ORF type:complete len:496 (+),score=143.22 TRINITY_DN23268_c0_g1_i1:62-1489(+)
MSEALEDEVRALVAEEERLRDVIKEARLDECLATGLVDFFPASHYQRRYRALVEVLKRSHKEQLLSKDRDTVEAFVALGGGKDKSGAVRSDLLRKYVKDFGLTIDIDGMIREVDTDDSGLIEYEEFEEMLAPDDICPMSTRLEARRSVLVPQAAPKRRMKQDAFNPSHLPEFLTFRTHAPRLRRSRRVSQHGSLAGLRSAPGPEATSRKASIASKAAFRKAAPTGKGRFSDGQQPTSVKKKGIVVDPCLKFPPPWGGSREYQAMLKDLEPAAKQGHRAPRSPASKRGLPQQRAPRHESIASSSPSRASPAAAAAKPAAVVLPPRLEEARPRAEHPARSNIPTVEVRLLPPPSVPSCIPKGPTWAVDFQRCIQRPYTADAVTPNDAAPGGASSTGSRSRPSTREKMRVLRSVAQLQQRRLTVNTPHAADTPLHAPYAPPIRKTLDHGVPSGWHAVEPKRWHHADALRVGLGSLPVR